MNLGDYLAENRSFGEAYVWEVQSVFEDFVSVRPAMVYDETEPKLVDFLNKQKRNRKSFQNIDSSSKKFSKVVDAPTPWKIGTRVARTATKNEEVVKGHYMISSTMYSIKIEIKYMYIVQNIITKKYGIAHAYNLKQLISPGTIWNKVNEQTLL